MSQSGMVEWKIRRNLESIVSESEDVDFPVRNQELDLGLKLL